MLALVGQIKNLITMHGSTMKIYLTVHVYKIKAKYHELRVVCTKKNATTRGLSSFGALLYRTQQINLPGLRKSVHVRLAVTNSPCTQQTTRALEKYD